MVEWSEALSGITGSQIKRGIDMAKKSCQWPPSIAEFAEYCRGNWEQQGAAYRPSCPALPKPKANKAHVLQNLEEIRKAIG